MAKKSNVAFYEHPMILAGLPGLLGGIVGLGFTVGGSVTGYGYTRLFGRMEQLADSAEVDLAARWAVAVPWAILLIGLSVGSCLALLHRRLLVRRKDCLTAMLCQAPEQKKRFSHTFRRLATEWPLLAMVAIGVAFTFLSQDALTTLWSMALTGGILAPLALTWGARGRVYDAACAMEEASRDALSQGNARRPLSIRGKIVVAALVGLGIAATGCQLYVTADMARKCGAFVEFVDSTLCPQNEPASRDPVAR